MGTFTFIKLANSGMNVSATNIRKTYLKFQFIIEAFLFQVIKFIFRFVFANCRRQKPANNWGW